jgi:hypothetical protein
MVTVTVIVTFMFILPCSNAKKNFVSKNDVRNHQITVICVFVYLSTVWSYWLEFISCVLLVPLEVCYLEVL